MLGVQPFAGRGKAAQSGTSGRAVFPVTLYGAVGDDTADDTAAIQAAVDAAVAAGGGVVWFDAKTYKFSSVTLPARAKTASTITVEFVGPFAPQTAAYAPGDGVDMPALTGCTILRSTATSGDAIGVSGAAYTNIKGVFRRLIVRSPANPSCNGFNGRYLAGILGQDAMIDVPGSYGGSSIAQPTHGTVGLYLPELQNSGDVVLSNVGVVGYAVGVAHSEHAILDNVNVFKCAAGIRVDQGYHAARWGRVMVLWCITDVTVGPAQGVGITPLDVSELDIEEAFPSGAWYDTSTHIYDPSNWMTGRLRWRRIQASTGALHRLTINGASQLQSEEIGATKAQFKRRTSGNISVSSATWANLDTGLDLAVPATVGDLIEIGVNGRWAGGTSRFAGLDVASLVSGSIVNYWGSAVETGTNEGVDGWIGDGSAASNPIGGSVMRAVVAGDLAFGVVTVRFRARVTSGLAQTLQASTSNPLDVWIKNLGKAYTGAA